MTAKREGRLNYSKPMLTHVYPFSLFFQVMTCRLLITFANSLYTDQDRQNVGPDELNYLTL